MAKSTDIYSHSSEGWKSEIKVFAGLIPPRASEGEVIPCLSPSFWWLLALLAW